MCDPVSIGLTLAGTALQGVSQSQIAGAQKKDIAANGVKYQDYVNTTQNAREGERTAQTGFFNDKMGTVADTLANYSRPNQDQLVGDAASKRQADYVAPINNMSFGAPTAPGTSSAVTSRNDATAAAAKSKSIGEALAKGTLDAYGDANIASSAKAADNARQLAITQGAASRSQSAENVLQDGYAKANDMQQNTLQSKMEADKSAGSFTGGLGDLFTAAGSLVSLGGGLGMFGTPAAAGTGAAAGFNFPALPGSGVLGGIQKAFNYVSPFGISTAAGNI